VRVVVALGDGAVRSGAEPLTVEGQRAAVAAACACLAPVAEVHELVIAHGKGPLAGLLSLPAPVHEVGSPVDCPATLTEGMIGYLLEQELSNLLPAEAPLATVLTMVEVDPDDAAFAAPTTFVGPLFAAGPARRIAEQRGWVLGRDGDSWRRVVPSPRPRRIVETRPVEWLLARGCVVICSGGGGIPAMYQRRTHTLVAVEAVVDENRASAVLALDLGADLLVIADGVDAVYLDWGTPDQRAIVRAHPDALDPELFPGSAMAARVEAAAAFARSSGRSAIIGSLEDLPAMLAGDGGTRITVQAEGMETR